MQWTPYVCSYLLTGITALLLWLRWGDIPPMVSIDNSYGTHELAAKTVWTVFDDVFFALGLVTACTIWAVFNHLKRGQYRTAMSPSARRRAQLLSESQQQSIGWLTICFTLCLNLLSITVFPTFANSGKTLYILNVAIIVGVVVALSNTPYEDSTITPHRARWSRLPRSRLPLRNGHVLRKQRRPSHVRRPPQRKRTSPQLGQHQRRTTSSRNIHYVRPTHNLADSPHLRPQLRPRLSRALHFPDTTPQNFPIPIKRAQVSETNLSPSLSP